MCTVGGHLSLGAISRAWAAADNPANAGGTIKRTWTSAEKMVLLSLIVALPPGVIEDMTS